MHYLLGDLDIVVSSVEKKDHNLFATVPVPCSCLHYLLGTLTWRTIGKGRSRRLILSSRHRISKIHLQQSPIPRLCVALLSREHAQQLEPLILVEPLPRVIIARFLPTIGSQLT